MLLVRVVLTWKKRADSKTTLFQRLLQRDRVILAGTLISKSRRELPLSSFKTLRVVFTRTTIEGELCKYRRCFDVLVRLAYFGEDPTFVSGYFFHSACTVL
jgi:hypothetical protein